MNKIFLTAILTTFIAPFSLISAQELFRERINFTKQDTLRGSITPEREWWDLTYYHLDIKVNPNEQFISGKNTIQYKVLKNQSVMQIDLQSPLLIMKVTQNNISLDVKHEGNAHYITLTETQNIGDVNSLDVYYEGKPQEAKNAPWDGGFSWKKESNSDNSIRLYSC